MRVFKFGGASVKDADGVRNVTRILRMFPEDEVMVVVSAMGKTTNKLELLWRAYIKGDDAQTHLEGIRSCHADIVRELFGDDAQPVLDTIDNTLVEVEWVLEETPQHHPDFYYDQIVSIGEVISTRIISAYMTREGLGNTWLDARDLIRTDNTYRDGRIQWDQTVRMTRETAAKAFASNKICITQGFMGGTDENFTTTLGREGSDFTAAILAYSLDAEEVVIWKDVPGVLNADPKWFDDTVLIPQISYHDAVELAYFGTSVIHPKTIKPLQNKGIPLRVKSFVNPDGEGTVVSSEDVPMPVPSFIFRMNQVLISIMPLDYSFIVENNLRDIFSRFAAHGVRINVMQNSAVSFGVAVDNDPDRLQELVTDLSHDFKVVMQDGLELITIRYFDDTTIARTLLGKKVLMEIKSGRTVQMVVRDRSLDNE
jgi:aspartate kinase